MADKHEKPGAQDTSKQDTFFENGIMPEKKPQEHEENILTSPIDAEADKDVTLANLHMGSANERDIHSGQPEDADLQQGRAEPSDHQERTHSQAADTTDLLNDEITSTDPILPDESAPDGPSLGGGGSSIQGVEVGGFVEAAIDQPESSSDLFSSTAFSPQDTSLNGLTPLPTIDVPPVIGIDDNFSGREDEVITGSLLENETALTAQGLNLEAGQYETEQGGLIIVDDNGSFTYVPPENFAGEDRFPYEFFDDNGNSGSAEAVFSVAPVADAAAISAADSIGDEGTSIPLDISAALTDNDGSENLILSLNGLPAGTILSDGKNDSVVGENGTVDITDWDLSALSLSTPDGLTGTFPITFVAVTQDGDDVATTQQDFQLAINTVNNAPVALFSTLDAVEDGAAVNGQLSASDVDGDTLSYSLVSGPDEGSVIVNADGSYSFDPGADFQDLGVGESRDVSFTYEVDDGQGGTDQASVTVTVTGENDGPVVANVDLGSLDEDTSITITQTQLLANTTDIDGDTLSVTSLSLDDPSVGALNDNGDGNWTFTPNEDFNGDDIGLSFDVTDGATTQSGQAVVDITAVNDAPIAESTTLSADEDDTRVDGQLSASDIDGDDLIFHLTTAPSEGTVTVNEDGSFSFDPGGDFQDLGAGETRDISFTYEVDDGKGGTSQGQVTITVVGENDGPVVGTVDLGSVDEDSALIITQAQLLANASDIDGDSLSLTSLTLDDPTVGTLSDNEDGTWTFTPAENFNGDGINLSFDVTDGVETASGQASFDINAINDGPVATDSTADAVEDGATVNGQLNATDVDGDTLSYSLVSGPDEGSVTINPDGSFSFDPGTDFQDLDEGGSREVSFIYEVDDGNGGTDEATVTVTITGTNDGPVVGTVDLGSTDEDSALIITDAQLLSQSSDIDGDSLSVTSLSLDDPSIGTLSDNGDGSWTFTPAEDFNGDDIGLSFDVTDGVDTASGQANFDINAINDGPVAESALADAFEDGSILNGKLGASDVDGDTLSYNLVDGPVEGSVSINPDGSYSFNPGADFQDLGDGDSREVSFTYEVDDGDGGTDQATVTITVFGTNDGPIVGNIDLGSVDEDTTLIITQAQLLANASDVDGDVLTVSSVTLDDPSVGTLSDNGDGSWTFTPNEDFNGDDIGLSFDVSDGVEMASGQASFDINAINDGPVATESTADAVEDGATVNGQLSASDVDGDTLSYSLVSGPDEGSVIVNADGSYSFDPGADFQDLGVGESRDVSFTYEVDDGQGGTDQASVTVTVTGENDGPIAGTTHTAVFEDTASVSGQLFGSDTDGDDLSFSLIAAPAEGAVTVNPDGSYSFETDGAFEDLGVGETRDISFTYEVDDGKGGTSQGQVTITVVGENDGPVVGTVDLGSTDEDTALIITDAQLLANASDIDGDELSISAISLDDPSIGTLADNGDGSWTFTPNEDFNGDDIGLSFDVTDGVETASASAAFDINAVNDAPIAQNSFSNAVEDGAAVNGQLSASDMDGDTLSYSLVSGPDEGSVIVNADGSYRFDPGTDFQDLGDGDSREVSFTYEVDDGNGGTDEATVTVTVTGTNDGPVVGTVDLGSTDEDSSSIITEAQLLANTSDIDGDGLSVTAVGLDDASVGTLSDNGNGSWTFTPAENFSGDDIGLSFDVTDGTTTHSATAELDVTAVADAPVLDVTTDTPSLGVDFEDDTDFDEGGSQNWSMVDADSLEGWQTDNAGNIIEIGRETVYGGSDANNIIIELEANHGDASNLYTDVATQDGGVYTLEFDFSARAGQGGAASEIEVYWDGELIDTITPGSEFGFEHYSYTVEGDGDPSRLEFRASDASGQDSVGGLLDNISFTQTGFTSEAAIALNIDAQLTDVDRSESLSIEIGNLPEGTVLSDGVNSITIGDASESHDISGWDLDNTSLTPAEGFVGSLEAQITATSTESSNGDTESVSQTLSFNIVDMPDPDTGPESETGGSGGNIPDSGDYDNVIIGSDANDNLKGAGHRDFIEGGDGDDKINAAASDDFVHGGDGDDNIKGGSGDDILIGGSGDDVINGGAGNDLFIFGQNDGDDVVKGGNGNWVDTIDVSGENGDLTDGSWTVTLENGDTHTLSEGETLDLGENVSGTLEFDDGTMISFEGIERITW